MQRKNCNILYIGNKLSAFGYTPTTIDALGPALSGLGYNVTYAGDRVSKLSRMLQMLSAIIKRRKKADIVLIDTYSTDAFYFAYSCASLCKALGVKYIPILHGGNLPIRFLQSPGMCRAMFGNSYTNIAVSRYLAETLQKHNYQYKVIENSIDINQYPFFHRNAAAPNLLWVRSFDEIYNPQMALYALQAILKQYPAAKLTMVGPDKDGSLQKCKNLASELKIDTQVHFTGKLDKAAWIALSKNHDIFINTSSVDNMPLSVIEAMALGMPVISTNVGGLPFFLSTDNAILVGINDHSAMASAVISLVNDNELVSILSQSARKTAEQYDWNTIKEKWIHLFDQLSHA